MSIATARRAVVGAAAALSRRPVFLPNGNLLAHVRRKTTQTTLPPALPRMSTNGAHSSRQQHHDRTSHDAGCGRDAFVSGAAAAFVLLAFLPDADRCITDALELLLPVATQCDPAEDPAEAAAAAASASPPPSWPVFTRAQISAHSSTADGGRVWVTYQDGVYDVTDFVAVHPGGNKILLAAGKAVDPFWAIYAQHKTAHTASLMAKYRIGTLHAADVAAEAAAAAASASDAYASDPVRHPALIVRSAKPFNAEPPATLLPDAFVTPTELLFVRNHLPVPTVDPASYVLTVAGEGLPPDGVTFTLTQLAERFPAAHVTAALQCSGNRRADMAAEKAARGLAWAVGAMGNVTWSGVWLRDVLAAAGASPAAVADGSVTHVQFEGLDRDPASGVCYGASIPADKAWDPRGDVLLATHMNGEPLTRDHGYPVRVVVPGVTGARQVKWLDKIILSSEESLSLWQQKDYKVFPQHMDWENVDFSCMPAMQEMPVTSAICEPADGTSIPAGAAEVTLKGFAFSGGGRAISRVDVSVDGGATWVSADIVKAPSDPTPSQTRSWGWTLWRADVPIPEGARGPGAQLQCVVKAIDVAANTQPESPLSIWNFRGLANNSWHRVTLRVE